MVARRLLQRLWVALVVVALGPQEVITRAAQTVSQEVPGAHPRSQAHQRPALAVVVVVRRPRRVVLAEPVAVVLALIVTPLMGLRVP